MDSARDGQALRSVTIEAAERGFRRGISLAHQVAHPWLAEVGAAERWPTPTASMHNDGEEPEAFFERKARNAAKDEGATRAGTPLAIAAKAWPTPAARDWRSPNAQSRADRDGEGKGEQLPNYLAHLWYTPDVPNGGRAMPKGASPTGTLPDGTKRQVGLANQARSASSRLAPASATAGQTSSNTLLSLNPLFVEWLMGWPRGWTLIASGAAWLSTPARTVFACSATELFRFKQRMRSALSQLASPPAPAAQLNLFG